MNHIKNDPNVTYFDNNQKILSEDLFNGQNYLTTEIPKESKRHQKGSTMKFFDSTLISDQNNWAQTIPTQVEEYNNEI